MTAACESLGRHAGSGRAACKGVVLSLTDANGSACSCSCHGEEAGIAAGLPTAFAELVFAYPPCEDDQVLDDDELDDLLAEDADRRLDDEWLGGVVMSRRRWVRRVLTGQESLPDPRRVLLQDTIRTAGYLDAVLDQARDVNLPDTLDLVTAALFVRMWARKLEVAIELEPEA